MTSSSNFCVEFDNVSKKLGDHVVFDGINLQLPIEKTTAFVGTSGSGKTTLLQLVNGIHRADTGTVKVMNEFVPEVQVERFRRKIGYAVQGAGLFPHMSIYKNISIIAQMEHWEHTRIDERIDKLFDLVGLQPGLLTRYPYELSGGQQHRVGICRALMLEPDLLLLDEPFSSIDPMTRFEIHEQFKVLKANLNTSVLLVTHDLREAVHLADHLVVLANGHIAQQGNLDDVLGNPEPLYVKPLMDAML